MGHYKSDKKTMVEREEAILEHIKGGYSRAEIGRKLGPQFNTTEKAIKLQYDKVLRQVKECEDFDETRTVTFQRYEALYQAAYRGGNYKTACDILDKQSKLIGHYDRENTESTMPTMITVGERKLKSVGDSE